MRTYKIMAVPGPMLVVKGTDNIEKFLSIKPNKELTAAAKKRVAKFNKNYMGYDHLVSAEAEEDSIDQDKSNDS